jgi:hypothetical protein
VGRFLLLKLRVSHPRRKSNKNDISGLFKDCNTEAKETAGDPGVFQGVVEFFKSTYDPESDAGLKSVVVCLRLVAKGKTSCMVIW